MDFEKIKEILHDCFDDARDVLPFGDDYTFPDFWSWINSREVEIIGILSMVKPEDTSENSLHKHDVSNNEALESSSDGVAACNCEKPHPRFDSYNNIFCAKCNRYIAR